MKGRDGRMQRITLFYINVRYLENPVISAKKSICPCYQTHHYTEGKVITGFKACYQTHHYTEGKVITGFKEANFYFSF